jgi:site-specific DNA-methyltransferase (adenine-specific)
MRETYFSVREIIDTETIVLSDGRKIKLLGVKQNKEKQEAAVRFLQEKTKGQRVFIKADPALKDKDKDSHFYLYLRNRTCLNAQLIKYGFSHVDTSLDYRMKNRFIRYSESANDKDLR